MASLLSTVLAVWLHFGEEFYLEKKALGYLGSSLFIPLTVGLALRYPIWRPEHEALKKLASAGKILKA